VKTRIRTVTILNIRHGFAYTKKGCFRIAGLPPVAIGEKWKIETKGQRILLAEKVEESNANDPTNND